MWTKRVGLALARPVAGVHAPGLEVAADRAGRNLAIFALPWQPDFEVISLLRSEAHVARAEHNLAIGKLQKLQHLLSASGHALVFFERLLGRRDGDEFHLIELVLADHAARVLAGGARFRAEAIGAGGEAHGKLRLVENGFADEVCERDFGGRDEP